MLKLRDAIHGMIYIRPKEMEIINTSEFQRLRYIRQLATTYLVYPGAEHTRFGHSIGVMHLASRVIHELRSKRPDCFYSVKSGLQQIHWEWMEQMLRLMALTHDLGHPPFSHAGEDLLPAKCKHEDYTRAIIQNTEIGSIIDQIGQEFNKTHNSTQFPITAQAVIETYLGDKIVNNDQLILNYLMDSELDCDKMDYLLRDSHYCGVNYGHYDLARLLSSIDIGTHYDDDSVNVIAIRQDGLHAFEEFILARYFMFLQVYFHKTRRILDISLQRYLKGVLPNGHYPEPKHINKYLKWTDDKVLQGMQKHMDWDEVKHFTQRLFPRMVYQTSAHMQSNEHEIYVKIKRNLLNSGICSRDEYYEDDASRLPHNIPSIASSEEKSVYLLGENDITTNIRKHSFIIDKVSEKINIYRLYVPYHKKAETREFIRTLPFI